MFKTKSGKIIIMENELNKLYRLHQEEIYKYGIIDALEEMNGIETGINIPENEKESFIDDVLHEIMEYCDVYGKDETFSPDYETFIFDVAEYREYIN